MPQLLRCFSAQDYPQELIEWIIVDASEVPVEIEHPSVHYFRAEKQGPQSIGVMRNQTIAHATGDVMVNMDDDDYYFTSWVSYAARSVWPTGLAGVIWRYNLDVKDGTVYKSGPYRKWLSPAGMTAFTREYSEQYRYGENGMGRRSDEEIKFTRGYHNPLTALDQAQSGVGIVHGTNSCNTIKRPASEMTMEDLIDDEPSRDFYRSFRS